MADNDINEPNDQTTTPETTSSTLQPDNASTQTEVPPANNEQTPTPTTTTTPEETATKDTTVTPEKEIEFDPDAFKAQVTQEITDKIVSAMTGGKTESNIKEKSPWEKENRQPKSYEEIAEWTAQLALRNIDERNRVKEEESKKQEEVQEQQKQQELKQWDNYWDQQISFLQENGKLGKAPEDVKDFWKQVAQVNKQRASENKPIIYSLTDFALVHYKPTVKQQIPGADAPIAGQNTDMQNNNNSEYSYQDIHAPKSFLELIRK